MPNLSEAGSNNWNKLFTCAETPSNKHDMILDPTNMPMHLIHRYVGNRCPHLLESQVRKCSSKPHKVKLW